MRLSHHLPGVNPAMAKPEPTALQTTFRLAIMLATLGVVSMAAYLYGPKPAQVAEAVDRFATIVAGPLGEPQARPAEPAPLVASLTDQAAPLAAPAYESPAAAAAFDPAVEPTSVLLPIDSAPDQSPSRLEQLDPLEAERLTAPLLAAGASQAEVTSWGRGEDVVYRATASAPVSGGASRLEQRFDAIGVTPQAAVDALLAEIQHPGSGLGDSFQR